MKKKWSVFLCLIMGIGLLAGCSGKADNPNKLTAWVWNVNVPVLEAAEKRYQKNHPEFDLEIVEMGTSDVYQKLTTGLLAGGQGLPDIVLVEDDRIQGYIDSFPDAFLNLSKQGFDEKKESMFPEFKRDLVSKDGDMYAFPFDAGPTGVFYRKDLFDKAGVNAEDMKTWTDFIEAGKTIKEKTGKDMIGLDLNGDDGLYRMMLNQQGTFYFDENEKPNLTSSESVKAMEVHKQLKEADLVKNTVGWDAWISSMVQGDVATAPSGAWLAGSITQQGKDSAGKWGVIPLPAFEEGGNRASNLGGSNYTIMKSSENKETAYDFLEYFSTDEQTQIEAMNGGLFPSLTTIYDEEVFTNGVDFFGGQAVWKTLADQMTDIPSVNYTGDFPYAKDEAVKAQSQATGGKLSIQEAFKAAQKRLKNRML
ncbi:ABC transporter substrate-binding protein [Bacillus sp. SJS]|uniref:ABC transporter substrate-binding protein n=1 Tax=Bacillus sp. SJS TaxID=1423321 RepID=UPI0004DD1C3A|nr:sugar ABC transporter substrate-binding protein [Bacillus sp. SJS]KZZ84643.1 sugar ABC transporter substrate-binding protein [Bacillus sp. SJS]